MIRIIDYGLGNVASFLNAYKALNIQCDVARHPSDLENASHIILPGVGSFDFAMNLFNSSGLRDVVESKVVENKVPLLGICVGMQILGDQSEEGSQKGLGWINGSIEKLKTADSNRFPLPHMGWNSINITTENKLFDNVDKQKGFYFLHSYIFQANKYQIASADYTVEFCCSINNENIYGVQFHPEKSLSNGLELLKNFSNI